MVGILELTSSVYLCVLASIKNIAGIPDVCNNIFGTLDAVMSALMACGK